MEKREGRRVVGVNRDNSQMGMIRRKKKNHSVALRAKRLSNV